MTRSTLVLLLAWAPLASGQLVVSTGPINLNSFSFGSPPVAYVDVADLKGAHVQFKCTTNGNGPNFLLIIPCTGTTPASVQVGLNPNVVALFEPGASASRVLNFTTVGATPASGSGTMITYKVPAQPRPDVQSVVNSASLQPLLAPGAQVSICGSHLTGPTLSTTYDETAFYPTSVADTSVLFNGIAAPLLYLSPGKIRAIVPFALAGQTSVQVVVQRFNQRSEPFTLPLQDTAPGIFTDEQSGTGAGPILQALEKLIFPCPPLCSDPNAQYTPNGPDNPASAGMTLLISATGQGVWTPPPLSDVFIFGEGFRTQPVSVTIGGQPAKLKIDGVGAGTAGTYNTWSVLLVGAFVPEGLSPGPQPVVLTIGANDSSQQQVTLWVQ